MINKTLELKLFGKNYTVKFPITSEFIYINNLRAKLTQSQYDSLKYMEADGLIASLIVDAVSHFSVLIPDLKKDLNVEGLLQLPMDKMVDVCWVYSDIYLPWYSEIMDLISKKKTESKTEDKIAV